MFAADRFALGVIIASVGGRRIAAPPRRCTERADSRARNQIATRFMTSSNMPSKRMPVK